MKLFLKWKGVLVPSSLCSHPAICLWKNFSQRTSVIREVRTCRNKGKQPPPLTSGPALRSDHENVVERTPHVFWDCIWRSPGAFTFFSEGLSYQVRICLHCWWDHMGVRSAGSAEREAVSTPQGSLRRPPAPAAIWLQPHEQPSMRTSYYVQSTLRTVKKSLNGCSFKITDQLIFGCSVFITVCGLFPTARSWATP